MFNLEFFGWGDLSLRMRHNWRPFFAIIAPIILLPIPVLLHDHVDHEEKREDPNQKFRCAYAITLMACFWILEVIPLAVTALFPLVLFPLLRVQDAANVSQNYMRESNMIFLGAIIIALSIEYSGLHIRGALKIISVFGARPPRIMLGTMLVTGFLAMWISDTSVATMILPILSSLTAAMFQKEQLEEEPSDSETDENYNGPDPAVIYSRMRGRRQSNVFANSSLTTKMPKRKSRRSVDSTRGSIRRKPATSLTLAPPPVFDEADEDEEKEEADDESEADKNPRNKARLSLPVQLSKMGNGTEKPVPRANNMVVIVESVPDTADADGDEAPAESVVQSIQKFKLQLKEKKEKIENLSEADQQNVRKMLLFAVAYSANIGGTGTLIGTGPVKLFKEMNKKCVAKEAKAFPQISFANWMAFNIPTIIINIFVVWLFLNIRYYGIKNFTRRISEANTKREKEKIRKYLDEENRKLGPMTSHEIGVLLVFILIVILWVLRDPQMFPGWGALFKNFSKSKLKTGDSTPAMFAAALLFILPRNWNFLNFKKPYKAPPAKYEALLDWKFVSTSAPWGYVLLIGSGYAIADACQFSGLSQFIGDEFEDLRNLPHWLLLIIVMIGTNILTEVVSNTACAALILPILFSISCEMGLHPSYLTMASALVASYAFMLPISSPPNGIIFATGELNIREMLVNGFILNTICSTVLFFSFVSYGDNLFKFSAYKNANFTCSCWE